MNKKSGDNLIFIGMMGAGKSNVARGCARLLERDFFDTDEIYCREYGIILETFKKEGEAVFRDRENRILQSLSIITDAVIATGGGAVLSDSLKFLACTGTVIWLRATVKTLFDRLKKHDEIRPLFFNYQSLNDIALAREELYYKFADIIIDTDNLSISQTIDRCIREAVNRK